MKSTFNLVIGTLAVASAVLAIYDHTSSPAVIVHAQGKSGNAPGQQGGPSPVGAWFGVARPCPPPTPTVAGGVDDDTAHATLCQQICGKCSSVPGSLPPEVPMMPSILGDGNVVVNDAGSIPVFHTTAQGQWAADPDPAQPQLPGRTRYQATFVWLQGSGGPNAQFVGVARPRFVTYFDENNPDVMVGYIQPHFFPIVGAGGKVNVVASNLAGSFEANHLIAPISPLETTTNFLGPLPAGCKTPIDTVPGFCLGTYHFTIHRITASVPNSTN
jgi:hypothetical protein